MNYRKLIILLFWGITSQLWSQEIIYQKFSEATILSELEATTIRMAEDITGIESVYFKGQFPSVNRDTVINCDTLRKEIIKKAHDYIGVRYCYGKSCETAFDCSGYVKFIYKSFGLTLPHSSYYQYKMSKHMASTEAKPGDLVFFITRGKGISHVGIYLGENLFIHSPGRGRYVSVDTLDTGYYHNHLVGFGAVL
jgi:cell wall-associated NlpC family hydrolase